MNATKECAVRPIYSLKKSDDLLLNKRNDFMSDDELWDAFKAGNEQAYELMFKEHYNLLLNYGLKFNKSEDDVKDHIQHLFAGLWESRSRLGKNNSIKSYLLASLRRMVLRGNKSRRNFLDLSNISGSFHLEISSENRYIKNQKEQDQVNFLSKILEKLPKRQKEAIYLKYYGEHSIAEIAEIMEISAGVVYKLIYKALNNLSSRLGDHRQIKDLLLFI